MFLGRGTLTLIPHPGTHISSDMCAVPGIHISLVPGGGGGGGEALGYFLGGYVPPGTRD